MPVISLAVVVAARSIVADKVVGIVALADSMVVVGMVTLVATVVGIAYSAEDVAIAVAAHEVPVEAIPTLDWEGTRLAVALVDCPSPSPLDST